MDKLNNYTFKDLEKYLDDWNNRNKFLLIKNVNQDCTAIMHVFSVNFCGDWKSGDGVLFYSDGEVHSSEPDDIFLLIDIVSF